MIQRDLRGKGLAMIASDKVFKPPTKPSFTLMILTCTKIKLSMMRGFSLSAAEGRAFKQNLELFQPHN